MNDNTHTNKFEAEYPLINDELSL